MARGRELTRVLTRSFCDRERAGSLRAEMRAASEFMRPWGPAEVIGRNPWADETSNYGRGRIQGDLHRRAPSTQMIATIGIPRTPNSRLRFSRRNVMGSSSGSSMANASSCAGSSPARRPRPWRASPMETNSRWSSDCDLDRAPVVFVRAGERLGLLDVMRIGIPGTAGRSRPSADRQWAARTLSHCRDPRPRGR
jgi:hypothetical protein